MIKNDLEMTLSYREIIYLNSKLSSTRYVGEKNTTFKECKGSNVFRGDPGVRAETVFRITSQRQS